MEEKARTELRETCSMLYDRNLTVSAGGNVSVRLNSGSILITPSGRNKGLLKNEDLVVVNMDGTVMGEGRPSIETGFHLALYRSRKDVNAVVHCHPIYCTAVSIDPGELDSTLTPEGVILLGKVPTVPYKTPGTPELVSEVVRFSDHNAMIMERHGALTLGKDLGEAYNRMEELEFQARLQILCKNSKGLPENEVQKLEAMK